MTAEAALLTERRGPDAHDAYARLDLAASPYGVFMAGPSATGDIEGVIVHGAQGARSLTVLLCPERKR